MSNNRYIVIVGCGRLGSQLAADLSHKGNSVVVIDKNDATFEKLSADFSGFRLTGDAARISVLKEAKLNEADVLIAATHDDNVNLMAAQIAQKIFKVPRVLARMFDPKRMEIYARLGVETICPTFIAAELFLRAVNTQPEKKGEIKP